MAGNCQNQHLQNYKICRILNIRNYSVNSENSHSDIHWYDTAGERTVKQSGGSEGVFVNGVLSGARTETGKFTAYISPYMVVSNGGNYSKHIYMGSQRIVSKLSNSGGLYFYHPDHLGSSSLITDGTGALTQHIRYAPFGEVFVEERTNSWSTPYKFNGKELDEETGLYYYHARSYDPRLSVWLSVDPLAEKSSNSLNCIWSRGVFTVGFRYQYK